MGHIHWWFCCLLFHSSKCLQLFRMCQSLRLKKDWSHSMSLENDDVKLLCSLENEAISKLRYGSLATIGLVHCILVRASIKKMYYRCIMTVAHLPKPWVRCPMFGFWVWCSTPGAWSKVHLQYGMPRYWIHKHPCLSFLWYSCSTHSSRTDATVLDRLQDAYRIHQEP